MTDPRATWRADPTKTFYCGIALGLMPFVMVLLVLLAVAPCG